MQIYGLTRAQTGQVLSMLAVGMIVGSPTISFVSNRIFKGRKPVLVLAGCITLCLVALLAFYTDRLPYAGLYLICFGLGIFSSAVVVIGFTTTKELFPVQMAGTSTGLVNIFPFFGGAVFQPVFGYILERHGRTDGVFTLAGYEQGFFVLFICSIIALLAGLCTQETLSRD